LRKNIYFKFKKIGHAIKTTDDFCIEYFDFLLDTIVSDIKALLISMPFGKHSPSNP